MKVVLCGNPNAGKTTLFNALTKSNLKTGNFHGVTTSPATKIHRGITFVDVPGAYSFSPYSMEEKSACDEIKSADLIVNVVDATTLETSLNFTRGIMSLNKKMLIYITKTRQLERRGGHIDGKKLASFLNVPVYICSPAELKKVIFAENKDGQSKGEKFLKSEMKTTGKIALNGAYYAGNVNFSRAEN